MKASKMLYDSQAIRGFVDVDLAANFTVYRQSNS